MLELWKGWRPIAQDHLKKFQESLACSKNNYLPNIHSADTKMNHKLSSCLVTFHVSITPQY